MHPPPPFPPPFGSAVRYEEALAAAGWLLIRGGAGGRVYHRPGDAEVVKVVDGDVCYHAFVSFVLGNPPACLPTLTLEHWDAINLWGVVHIERLPSGSGVRAGFPAADGLGGRRGAPAREVVGLVLDLDDNGGVAGERLLVEIVLHRRGVFRDHPVSERGRAGFGPAAAPPEPVSGWRFVLHCFHPFRIAMRRLSPSCAPPGGSWRIDPAVAGPKRRAVPPKLLSEGACEAAAVHADVGGARRSPRGQVPPSASARAVRRLEGGASGGHSRRPRRASGPGPMGGSMFRLVSENWNGEVLGARRANPDGLFIVCPFIKERTVSRILKAGRAWPVSVITRFDLSCYYAGVSDLDALAVLLAAGARVRGVRGLHSKLYLFGGSVAIATSANVTEAAMLRNHEFGFVSDEAHVLTSCAAYFERLWARSGEDLTKEQLRGWRETLDAARARDGGGPPPRLPDHGADAGGDTPLAIKDGEGRGYENQAFLKFFGRGSDRTPRHLMIADIVAESGCNWACTYPTSSRPRQVGDGDRLYMARIAEPDDLLIFGYATGWRHRDEEDVASRADVEARPWKVDFANYVRVHDGRFVDAELGAGVSMYEMLEELGSDAWRSTQENTRSGSGNRDPFASYLRKPGMQLTDASRAWLDDRLEALFRQHGEVDLSPRRYRPPR